MAYSVGFELTEATAAAIDRISAQAWTPAYDADGVHRDGAWVAELTGLIDLTGWPEGMRVIIRKERPVRREALLIRMEVLRPLSPILSQQGGEAGGSLNWVTPGRVGSSPDKAGTCQHCQMVRVRRA